jgi:hypothetical protein
MRSHIFASALLAASLIAAPASAAGPASALIGEWKGSYACLQGHTGLILTIAESADTAFKGEFAFFPLPDNPRVPKGRFAIEGTFNPKTSRVDIKGVKWMEQPTNYRMVDLHGVVSDDGSAIDGKVEFTGCSGFHVALQGKARQPTKPKDSAKTG